MKEMYKTLGGFLLASLFTSGLMAEELRFIGSNSMAVGNTWSYDMAVTLWDNEPVNFSGTGTVTVTGTQVIGTYNASVALIDSPWGIMTKYYYQTEDALLFLGSGSASDNIHRAYRNLDPLEVEPFWVDTSANDYHFGHGEFNVNQDDPAYSWTETNDTYITYLQSETVNVPAGSFECITVMISDFWSDSDGFYGYVDEIQSHDPAIGIIKTESYEWFWDEWSQASSATEYTWELISTNVTPHSYLDDFDDNIMGSEWAVMSSNEANFWLSEINQRLEIGATAESDDDFALYIPNGWHLDTSQDFGIKIRYYNELDSVTWSELLFALGDSSDIENNHLQFSVCSLDDGENTGPHFYYELVQNSSEIDDLYVTRPSNDGWIFISYDAVLDEVYFGVDGYGSANSLKTVSGLLQGDWAGMNISPHLGGSSDHVEILSGEAYWDDFAIDYGEIIQDTMLTVTSPVSNKLWGKGQSYDIEWSTDHPSPNVKIVLFKGDSKVLTIKNPTANDDIHSWKIPTTVPKGTNYRIKVVCLADTTVYGFSDPFEIVGPCDLYTPIEVSEPSIAAEWEMGKPYSIQWTGGESEQDVKIQLFKGTNLKQTIATSTPNDGEHDFTVRYGLTPGSNYRVKVKVLGSTCSSSVDFSEDFEIKAPVKAPVINVEVPDSTSVWVMGGSYPIMWSGDYFPGGVKIKLFKGSTAVKTISKRTVDDGHHTWAKVPYSLPPGSNYRVKVISINNNTIAGFSDYFTIVVPPINVTKPTSSTEWKRGYKHEIRWTGGKPAASVKIQLLKDNKYLKTLTSSTPNDGVFKWKVPSKQGLGINYSIRVIYLPDTTLRDTSQTFTVINSPVGTWNGRWYDWEGSARVRVKFNKNGTISGSLVQPLAPFGSSGSVTIYINGEYAYYAYNDSTGDIDFFITGRTTIQGYPVRVWAIGIGTLVNNEIYGSYEGAYDVYGSGYWWEYLPTNGNFMLQR